MTDARVAELLLAACRASGALSTFTLLYELQALAGDREFTTPEVVAHARLPGNARLRAAIQAAAGEIDARKLARLLSRWREKDVGLRSVVTSIGVDHGWILWKFAPLDLSPARTGERIAAIMGESQRC